MDKHSIKNFIAARVAKELSDGDIVNLGIGLPTLVPAYLPDGVSIVLHSENGIVGTGPVTSRESAQPRYLTDAGGQPAAILTGGAFIDSCVSFGLARGGHVDVTVLGALEVDEQGNLANWIIPGIMAPGMGGAMDIVAGSKKVIIAMEHTAKGALKIRRKCVLPLTAVKCVDIIVTEMGFMRVKPEGGILLCEINPEYTLEQVIAATEAELEISPDLISMGI